MIDREELRRELHRRIMAFRDAVSHRHESAEEYARKRPHVEAKLSRDLLSASDDRLLRIKHTLDSSDATKEKATAV